MKEYVEVTPARKLDLLQKHSMGEGWQNLDQTKWCLHCGEQFTGQSVRVYRDETPGLWLECGTPDCDGSPLDWASHPWWDETHPATIAHEAALKEIDRSGDPEKN